ncbi:unnamed protein product [Malus baccata var. baccata]
MRPIVKNNVVEAYASDIDYEAVASKIQAGQIQYSDKYFDDIYEFRHVTKLLPKNGLLCEVIYSLRWYGLVLYKYIFSLAEVFSLNGHINTTCVLRFNLYNVGTKELTSPSSSEFTLSLQII